jgi:hypothetical protein
MEQQPDSPAATAASSAASLEADLNPLRAADQPIAVRQEAAPPAAQHHAPPPAALAPLDAHGHDPADYRWVPVLRKPRSDGWSPQRQVDFIAALADTGCVEVAAREVGMTAQSCYRLRRSPGAENFSRAWDAALQQASRMLADLAFDRAINGSDEPVFDREGRRVGRRMRHNDKLLMFLLRAYQPERFRHAHQSVRHPAEPPPPEAPPLADAIRTLEPAPPDEPHLLTPPDELESAFQCADIMDGKLPHWHRYKRHEDRPVESPLGPEFERALEAAKREAAGLPPEPDDAEADDWEEDENPFLD